MTNINEVSPADAMNGDFQFDPRFEGATLKNGDVATGFYEVEDGHTWYHVIGSDGMPYETKEMPCIHLDLCITHFLGSWNSEEVRAHFQRRDN